MSFNLWICECHLSRTINSGDCIPIYLPCFSLFSLSHIFNSMIYCLLLLALKLLISFTLSNNLWFLTSHLFRVNWLSRWFGATFWTQMVYAVCSGPLWCCLRCIIRHLSPQSSCFTHCQRSYSTFPDVLEWQLCCRWLMLKSTTDETDALGQMWRMSTLFFVLSLWIGRATIMMLVYFWSL